MSSSPNCAASIVKKAKAVFQELYLKPFFVELDEKEDRNNILCGSQPDSWHLAGGLDHKSSYMGGSDGYESGELAKLLGIDSQNKDDVWGNLLQIICGFAFSFQTKCSMFIVTCISFMNEAPQTFCCFIIQRTCNLSCFTIVSVPY